MQVVWTVSFAAATFEICVFFFFFYVFPLKMYLPRYLLWLCLSIVFPLILVTLISYKNLLGCSKGKKFLCLFLFFLCVVCFV